ARRFAIESFELTFERNREFDRCNTEPVILDVDVERFSGRQRYRIEFLLQRHILRLCIFGRPLDERGRMRYTSRAKQRAKILEVKRFADIKKVQDAEIAFGEHVERDDSSRAG